MSTSKKIRETYNETQHKIVRYLQSGITKGKHYFKSKYIAKDLGLSPKEVGTNMAILADICKDLNIIRWSIRTARRGWSRRGRCNYPPIISFFYMKKLLEIESEVEFVADINDHKDCLMSQDPTQENPGALWFNIDIPKGHGKSR